MSSTWAETVAVLRKETLTEVRSRSGLTTSALFSLVTVVAVSLATFDRILDKDIAAALLWIAILFAAVPALPRAFLAEEEQGTADLLRLVARPEAVFWGKALFNLGQVLATAALLSFLFFGFTHVPLSLPWLYAVSLVGGCGALAGAITLCGALVSRAANRSALVGAIAVPLLLPLVALGVSGMRVAIGPSESDLMLQGGVRAGAGLVCYGIATMAIGSLLFPSVWKS